MDVMNVNRSAKSCEDSSKATIPKFAVQQLGSKHANWLRPPRDPERTRSG